MSLHRAHRRLATWIAALAVLLAALAPAISHAVGARDVSSWIEVCTPVGSKWMPSDAAAPDEGAPAPSLDHALDHCPYCSVHAPTVALPPAVPTPLPADDRAQVLPRAFLQAPLTLHAWVQAPSRAPPSAS